MKNLLCNRPAADSEKAKMGAGGGDSPFRRFRGVESVYALEVRGDSMIDEHIFDGDSALVETAGQARNGEIAAASIDGGETVLMRVYREGGRVRLQPANSAMEPIVVPAERVRIEGRVLAVHRRFR